MSCTNSVPTPASIFFLSHSTKSATFLLVLLFFFVFSPGFGIPAPGTSNGVNSTFSFLSILRCIHLPLGLSSRSRILAYIPPSSALLTNITPSFLSHFERKKFSTFSSNESSRSNTDLPASAAEFKFSLVHITASSNISTALVSSIRVAENSTHGGAPSNSDDVNLTSPFNKRENGADEFDSVDTDSLSVEVPTATPFEEDLSSFPTLDPSNAADNELTNSTLNITNVNDISASDINDEQKVDGTSYNGGAIVSFLAEARSHRNRIMNGGFIELIEWLFVFILVAPGTFPAIGCVLYSCTSFFHRRLLTNGEPPVSATIHPRRYGNIHPTPVPRQSLFDQNTSFTTRPRHKTPSDEREDL